jgi:hypothetical protein
MIVERVLHLQKQNHTSVTGAVEQEIACKAPFYPLRRRNRLRRRVPEPLTPNLKWKRT